MSSSKHAGNAEKPVSAQQLKAQSDDRDWHQSDQNVMRWDRESLNAGDDIAEIIFFGTGTSGCVPAVPCLTSPEPSCSVCFDARYNPHSKNRRDNTSIMIRFKTNDSDELRNVLIDCGKTFYHQAIKWTSSFNIRKLDSVILTHSHADAMMGLDDLRQWTLHGSIQPHVDVHLSQDTMQFVEHVFPYLVDTRKASGGGDVAGVQFHLLESTAPRHFQPIQLFDGVQIIPFEVEHGKLNGNPYYCLGFRFGNITYISDVSSIPESVYGIIEGSELIIMDALHDKPHPSHFSIKEAVEALEKLRPKCAFLTGFSHRVDHEATQQRLDDDIVTRGFPIKLSWDGLCLKFLEHSGTPVIN